MSLLALIRQSEQYLSDGSGAYTIIGSKFSVRKCGVKFAYFLGLLKRQFGVWMFVTFQRSASAFIHHVSHVSFMRAEKKVVRVYAKSVIARVANASATAISVFDFSNVAVSDYPHKPMRFVFFPVDFKAAISMTIGRTRPQPTGISFINLRPESIYNHFIHNASSLSRVVRGRLFPQSVPAIIQELSWVM